MPAAAFVDYYRILEVPPSASPEQIRRSFKRLVLHAHPDKNPDRIEWSERRIRELIRAYEVIGDFERRRRFDAECRVRRRTAPEDPRESQLFFFRKSDPGAYALRILYFLLHGRGREAVPLLAWMEARHGPGFLLERLDRGDYLDCLFLLGEHHLERRDYLQALRRLKAFYLHERNARHPRHYLDSVVAHLKDLYLRKLPQTLPPAEALRYLKEAVELCLGRRDREALARLTDDLRGRVTRGLAASR